jgi:hypothetical protein
MDLEGYRNKLLWSRTELARKSGLDYETVKKAETSVEIRQRTARILLQTLGSALNQEITFDDVEGLNVQGLKQREQQASSMETIAENINEMIAKIEADVSSLSEMIVAIPDQEKKAKAIGRVIELGKSIIGWSIEEKESILHDVADFDLSVLRDKPEQQPGVVQRTSKGGYPLPYRTPQKYTRQLKKSVKVETDAEGKRYVDIDGKRVPLEEEDKVEKEKAESHRLTDDEDYEAMLKAPIEPPSEIVRAFYSSKPIKEGETNA